MIWRVNTTGDVVRVGLEGAADLASMVAEFEKVLEEHLTRGHTRIIVDLNNVSYPSSKFIALLIEMTGRARRAGGDLKLINLSSSARNNLLAFNPLTVLTVVENERDAFSKGVEAGESPQQAFDFEAIVAEQPEGVAPAAPLPEPPAASAHQLQTKSTVESLYQICDFVTALAREAGMDEKDISKTRITVYEACLNIIEHAYQSDPTKDIDVTVWYDDSRFVITLGDRGKSFDFDAMKPYDVHQAVADRRIGGFGRYIIKRSMDEVRYHPDPVKGNTLVMTKLLR